MQPAKMTEKTIPVFSVSGLIAMFQSLIIARPGTNKPHLEALARRAAKMIST